MPNYFTELKNGPSGPSYKVKDEEARAALAGKVDKVEGKGLSTNDYSDTEKGKVADNAEAIEAMVNVNGAKNILPFYLNLIKKKSMQGTWNGNTYSYNGIDYTVNDDNTITANGTATDLSYIYLLYNQTLCEGGDYLLNGNMSGTEAEYTAYFYIYDNTTMSMIGYLYGSEDMDFSYVDGHSLTAGLEIPQGKTINNFIFKPMIRDARIADSTYVPYAMTNRELTERVDRGSVSVTGDGTKTYSTLLNELFALIDINKLSHKSRLRLGNVYISISQITNNHFVFCGIADLNVLGKMYAYNVYMAYNDSIFIEAETSTSQTLFTNHSSTVAPYGQVISLYY